MRDASPESGYDSPSPVDYSHCLAAVDGFHYLIDNRLRLHQHRVMMRATEQRSVNETGAEVGEADAKFPAVGELLQGFDIRVLEGFAR